MFFHFFEEAVFNAFVIRKKKGSTKRFLDHKLDLIRAILDETEVEKIDELVPSLPKYRGRHFLDFVPPTTKKEKPQKRCQVCPTSEKGKKPGIDVGTVSDVLDFVQLPVLKYFLRWR